MEENPWDEIEKQENALSKQNIDFILKSSADRTELVKSMMKNQCTVHPCQHRSPPAIGGENYFKEQNDKLTSLLIDVTNDEFEHMDDLKMYIREYML